MEIGKRIKERRKQLGISAEQLAEAINVSPATIYRYESGGIENMGVDKVTPIAKILHTNEAYLMGWTDDSSSVISSGSFSDIVLTPSEETLVMRFRELNGEGQEALLKQADIMIKSGEYIKSHKDGMVDEA